MDDRIQWVFAALDCIWLGEDNKERSVFAAGMLRFIGVVGPSFYGQR